MDLILYNAKIRTMDNQIPFASAVAVKDGIIFRVGTDEEILALKTPDTKIIDANKKLVLPGFIDTHMHNVQTGYADNGIMLFGAKSIDEIIERIKNFIAEKKLDEGAWVYGWGWNQDGFENPVFPTRKDLDKASIANPIAIARACGHIMACNTKAIELAGCLNNVPKFEGGEIDVDENGQATGIFRERPAIELLRKQFASADKEQIKKYILTVAKGLLEHGVTSIMTDDFSSFDVPYETVLNAYKELSQSGELPVRVYQQCSLAKMELLNDFINKGYVRADYGFYKLGPLKLIGDGSLGARTAYLAEDYKDEPGTRGIPVLSQNQLDELIITAHKAGMQVAVHAIGDGTMKMVLDAIEKAQLAYPRLDPRHGIVHCQITDMPMLERFRKLNVIAFIQPVFLDYDMHIVESRVGKEKASTSYAFNTMNEMGIHIAFGTDCPVERYYALPNIYYAVTRKDKKGFPEGGFYPEEKMSVYDAVKSYTQSSAYCSYEENIKGTITTGKYADMVVISEDIFEIEPEEIINQNILMTIVNGKVAYEA